MAGLKYLSTWQQPFVRAVESTLHWSHPSSLSLSLHLESYSFILSTFVFSLFEPSALPFNFPAPLPRSSKQMQENVLFVLFPEAVSSDKIGWNPLLAVCEPFRNWCLFLAFPVDTWSNLRGCFKPISWVKNGQNALLVVFLWTKKHHKVLAVVPQPCDVLNPNGFSYCCGTMNEELIPQRHNTGEM